MPITLGELARLVGGELRGDAAIALAGAATIDVAGPGHVTLADHPGRARALLASLASAVIASPDVDCGGKPSIVVPDVHAAFATAVRHFRPLRIVPRLGQSPQAFVSPTAKLGANVVPVGRNPMQLARQLAQLDRLSNGRVLLSLVPGVDQPGERAALGVGKIDRGDLRPASSAASAARPGFRPRRAHGLARPAGRSARAERRRSGADLAATPRGGRGAPPRHTGEPFRRARV